MPLGRIDRYELLSQIGQGSFGAVYRARHVHTGQIHALKLAKDIDPEGVSRVLAEARAAASLKHPNVVGIIDGGIAPTGEAFVVMELLEGITLAQLIAREGPLPPERATRIARQMLDGLAAAHANNIIHRDVKPSNVFITMASDVTGGDMVKVIDFGISKVRSPMNEGGFTMPGVAMGTPGYMAPEQLGDARSVDPRADIYAVGATLFEMITKRRPIIADSFETWMRILMTERAPSLREVAPHVPPLLASAVDRALHRDPDGRFASASAMRDVLDTALGSSPGGFAPTAWDTPRPVVQPTVGNTSSWPHNAGGPPPFTPPPYGERSPPPYGAPPVVGTAPYVSPPQAYGQYASPQMQSGVPTAKSGGSSVMWWLLGAVVVVFGALIVVGVGTYLYIARDGATAAAATAPPAAPAVAPPPATATTPAAPAAPPKGGKLAGPTPVAPGQPPAPAPAPAPGGKATGAVKIGPPRIVGELRQDAFFGLANRARPAIEACNADKRAIVIKVDVMIGDKKISIAQPSVNDNPGDPIIARCIANSLKDAQSPAFQPGDSGIYAEGTFTWQ